MNPFPYPTTNLNLPIPDHSPSPSPHTPSYPLQFTIKHCQPNLPPTELLIPTSPLWMIPPPPLACLQTGSFFQAVVPLTLSESMHCSSEENAFLLILWFTLVSLRSMHGSYLASVHEICDVVMESSPESDCKGIDWCKMVSMTDPVLAGMNALTFVLVSFPSGHVPDGKRVTR